MKRYVPLLFLTLLTIIFDGCKKDPEPIEIIGYQQYGEPFLNVPVTDDIVMYEVNLRAFSQDGNLAGVQQKLDHFGLIGVKCYMAYAHSNQWRTFEFPYCISNFNEVDEEYGTLTDLRNLVEEAHNRDMVMIRIG